MLVRTERKSALLVFDRLCEEKSSFELRALCRTSRCLTTELHFQYESGVYFSEEQQGLLILMYIFRHARMCVGMGHYPDLTETMESMVFFRSTLLGTITYPESPASLLWS